MHNIFQKILNFIPTKQIPNSKLYRFLTKLIYFTVRDKFKKPLIINTKFFKIYAYPSKKEASSVYFRNFHDYEILTDLNKAYKKNSKLLFLDIGANVGSYSLSIAKNYRNSKCLSFEPYKKYFNQFNKNIILNKLSNISAYNFCISNKNLNNNKFFINKTMPGGSSMLGDSVTYHPKMIKNKIKQIPIKSKTVDSILSRYNLKLYDNFLFKIDVEGAEKFVLDGSKNIIKKILPDILIEIEEKNFFGNYNISKNLIYLQNLGYSFYLNFFKKKVTLKQLLKTLNKKIKNKSHFHLDLLISCR